ncbi:hypothetical protein HPB50_016226 [Hyalomma asiaticum]|uniref:Uncharacterized protein n=1 Tax=Hyalomma asiaticum TaxID=266040 RepID=A0ACB7SFN8_HYAAI|nr:hypothetical protein HPB50_016226 [Hyalomma asiaticum]
MKRPREQSVLRQKLSVLLPPPHRPLHMPRATGSFPKLSVVRRDYVQEVKPEERDYYNTCIVCKSANELCVLTAGQSNCPRQHKECKVRVSSTSAHNILRTRRGPKAILRSLLNNFFSSVATAYGMHMEPVAREEFEKQHGIQATEIYAGNGKWLEKEAWGTLFRATTYSLLCHMATLLYWTPEELKGRSVTGKVSNKSRSKGQTEDRSP